MHCVVVVPRKPHTLQDDGSAPTVSCSQCPDFGFYSLFTCEPGSLVVYVCRDNPVDDRSLDEEILYRVSTFHFFINIDEVI